MKTVILPFASLSTHAFHVLDTTRSNPFQEHGTTLDRSPRQVIHPFQKRAMVVVSQHKPGENVSDHNISSGPNDEASSSGALQPSLPVNNANFPVKEGNQGNMPEQSVWVKVIQKTGGDNYEDLGDPFQILPRPANVSDLRNKVKEEAANTLAHVDANELLVFAPDKDYENDKPQLSVSGAMADRDDKAEGDKRDSSPAKGGGRGRRSGMGRGRGRGGARHAPDYWSLAQPEFRQWLSNITTKAEYNRLSIAERGQLLRDFGISQTTDEERRWKKAAAAYKDGSGTGIPLEQFDPENEDMTEVYEALNVTDFFARKRLNQYIIRLRKAERTSEEKEAQVPSNHNSASGFAARQHDQINIQSEEILEAWCQNIPPVPGIDDLGRVVQAPLPRALPSAHPVSISDRPIDDVISSSAALEDSVIIPELGLVRDAVHSLQKYGDNEDSVHSPIDNLVLGIMSKIGRYARCSFRMNRNGVDLSGATVSNLRPDVLVWLPSGVLAFKGEDKATPGEIQAARDELVTKLNCFSDAYFGGVPYLICYACGGNILEFWAINRDDSKLTSIAPQVDLATVGGRSLCVRYAVNISRVLLSLEEEYPEGNVIKLGDRIKTQSSDVSILGFFVVKKTCHFTNDAVLEELYGEIQKMQVPSLISVEKWKFSRRGWLTLQISPVGFCGKSPRNVAEVKNAGRQVLSALRWLHDHGWVHRDIRPANVMFADSRWYLMDLEWANRIDLDLEDYNPNLLPPELVVVESGGSWTKACDMWQFGKLVEQWNQLDINGHRYVHTQTQEDPAKRLSAAESLDHEFFG